MSRLAIFIYLAFVVLVCTPLWAHDPVRSITIDPIPSDLPLPTVSVMKTPADGVIFAAVPYWGAGASYLVAYSNDGNVVFYKKVSLACTDFKMQENGLLTYFDYEAKKYYALDSALTVVDSYAAQNGYMTDEHDLKILANGNALLIGYEMKTVDMSRIVPGGSTHANVIVNAIQEIDRYKKLVFEWKADEHYAFTDVGPDVNLLDESFQFTHTNSVDTDLDGNLIISSRHLNEITKIDRRTGAFIWRLGGKHNQFTFLNDTIGFSGQHSVRVLPNGNFLFFDNGTGRTPPFSRAVEYRLDTLKKTATLVWSYRNTPDVASELWGNAQRLANGSTFISWGYSSIAATEVDTAGVKVFEMSFPKNVFSYRVFRFPMPRTRVTTSAAASGSVSCFALEQNYPNPFNPSTSVRFFLPTECRLTLRVYDVLGRVITVLADDVMSSGLHEALWNAAATSGIYFYRLDAVSVHDPHTRFSRVRSMLLIR